MERSHVDNLYRIAKYLSIAPGKIDINKENVCDCQYYYLDPEKQYITSNPISFILTISGCISIIEK